MLHNKALAVVFVLCGTILARPIAPRSLDSGVEVLAARGPHDNLPVHPPAHPSHASSSSSHPPSGSHPIPIPHRSFTMPASTHPLSTSHGSDHSGSSYHTAHSNSPGRASPARSSSSGESVYGTPPHPDHHSISAIQAAGHKINPEKTIAAWPLNRHIPGVAPSTTHGWLEEGNSRAGMQHVRKHESQFAQQGIPLGQIPHHISHATQHGPIVGLQGQGDGRPVYQTNHNGQPGHVGVTMGSNGFVVGANPISGKNLRAAEKKWADHTTHPHDYYNPGGNPYNGGGSGSA